MRGRNAADRDAGGAALDKAAPRASQIDLNTNWLPLNMGNARIVDGVIPADHSGQIVLRMSGS